MSGRDPKPCPQQRATSISWAPGLGLGSQLPSQSRAVVGDVPPCTRVCVCKAARTRPPASTPPLSAGPHLSSPSPRFGFYKYMKMDEEEEDPRQRAFLFLSPDSESRLPAGSFWASLSSLARG